MAGLTACTASDKSPSPQVSLSTVTSTVTATVLPEQKSGVDGTVSDKKDLLITPEGKGVLFLRLNGEPLITDEMEMLEGKLISGPGGCLSVQPGGRPELLVFTAGTKFSDHPRNLLIRTDNPCPFCGCLGTSLRHTGDVCKRYLSRSHGEPLSDFDCFSV